MSASIYFDKNLKPDDKSLFTDLAETKGYLDKIAEFIETEYGNFKSEWKYYGQKSGWILKMLTGNRNVMFVIPCDNYFQVAFTFGEKASELIHNSDLPTSIKNELQKAKKYAEGRSIKIEAKSAIDLDNILKVIRIKLIT